MPNFGGQSGTDSSAPSFGGNVGGSFPKYGELVGSLVLMDPSSFEWEMVPGYKAKPNDPLVERLAADTVVLDGPQAGEYPGMWWGHQDIRKAAHRAERKGDHVLGRLIRRPKTEARQFYADEAALEAAFQAGQHVSPSSYIWKLVDGDTRAEDIALATKYLAGQVELNPDGPDGADPFGD